MLVYGTVDLSGFESIWFDAKFYAIISLIEGFCYILGQHGGRVLANVFNGGVGSDCRGYPVDFQATDQSRANGQGAYMQLLTGNMDNNHHNNLSSINDDLSTEQKQVC